MKTRLFVPPSVALALFMGSLLSACGPSVADACDKEFLPETFDCETAVEQTIEPCRNRDDVLGCFDEARDFQAFSDCEDTCWTDQDHARVRIEEAAERIREAENR